MHNSAQKTRDTFMCVLLYWPRAEQTCYVGDKTKISCTNKYWDQLILNRTIVDCLPNIKCATLACTMQPKKRSVSRTCENRVKLKYQISATSVQFASKCAMPDKSWLQHSSFPPFRVWPLHSRLDWNAVRNAPAKHKQACQTMFAFSVFDLSWLCQFPTQPFAPSHKNELQFAERKLENHAGLTVRLLSPLMHPRDKRSLCTDSCAVCDLSLQVWRTR